MSSASGAAAAMPRQVLQEKELRVLFLLIVLLFVVFLAAPLALVLLRSLTTGAGALTLANYLEVFSRPDFVQSIANSFAVSAASAFVAVLLAFLLSYTVNCTNVPAPLKRAIGLFAQLPMLVPTITYGFAIIYTFGRQGAAHASSGLPAVRHLRHRRPDARLRDLHAAHGVSARGQQLPLYRQALHDREPPDGRQAARHVTDNGGAPAGRRLERGVRPVVFPGVHRLRHPDVGRRPVQRRRPRAVQPDARRAARFQRGRRHRRGHAYPIHREHHPHGRARALRHPLQQDHARRAVGQPRARRRCGRSFGGGARVPAVGVRRHSHRAVRGDVALPHDVHARSRGLGHHRPRPCGRACELAGRGCAHGARRLRARLRGGARHGALQPVRGIQAHRRLRLGRHQHRARHGARHRLSVRVFRHAHPGHVRDPYHLQRRALLRHALPDDEGLPHQDERQLGDHGQAYGRLVDQDDRARRDAERLAHHPAGFRDDGDR